MKVGASLLSVVGGNQVGERLIAAQSACGVKGLEGCDAARACGRIRQLSVAELLAETIRRIAGGESVSSLYVD